MTRFIGVVVHNWPLKLAAIGLATLLYGGLVLSQQTDTLSGPIPINVKNQPPDTFLLSTIPPVTEVRYFSPSGARPISSTFNFFVDLSGATPGSGPQSVPVQVETIDDRIQVLSFEPPVVSVDLEALKTRTVPVDVDTGTVPDNLEVGETTVEPAVVQVSGPSSVVDRVVKVRAVVVIQPGGIDVDQQAPLTAVNAVGDAVSPVNIEPPTVRVVIPVFSDRESRTLPVNAVISGTPAAGFQITTVTIDPAAVTVEGDADALAALASADTAPVSVAGVSSSFETDVELALPDGVVALGATEVHVTIEVRAVTETRSYNAGLRLVGAAANLQYEPATDRVLVTIAGSPAELDRLTEEGVTVDLDVSGLGVGTTDVEPTASLASGLTVVGMSPETVPVTVRAPASPVPSASGGA